MLLGRRRVLDDILARYTTALGPDLAAYRNHVYRVVNFCAAFVDPAPGALERIEIAAAFHDLGIWTDHTFDYLAPSERLAAAYLDEQSRADWKEEIAAMIHQHHKLTPYRGDSTSLVEPFRKADTVDVSWGVVRFGLPRPLIRAAYTAYPESGFHLKLVRLSAARFVRHPLSPLPMVRL
jgi:hypothetical protein